MPSCNVAFAMARTPDNKRAQCPGSRHAIYGRAQPHFGQNFAVLPVLPHSGQVHAPESASGCGGITTVASADARAGWLSEVKAVGACWAGCASAAGAAGAC